jgi:lysophospholipase L1-like esterase
MVTDLVDTADKDTYIEFVGDSITCGWGTIGEHKGVYTDQDGTYAYSYLLAKELDADYSMTALSGQGLLCGNPGVTNGYLYADPLGNGETKYDFARKADIVVINIGTNDYSKKVGEAEFKAAYLSFLRTVREKNGDECKILCLYNTMNDTYANAILAAVEEFGGTFAGVTTYKLNRAHGNHHPNIAEHEAYASVLKDVIEDLPEKVVSDITHVTEGDGSLDFIDYDELKWD